MTEIILGLGSNVGDRLAYLRKTTEAIKKLPGFEFVKTSAVYETEPWGFKEQGRFLNCVVVCKTELNPELALSLLKELEVKIGRQERGKWKEREIDIDILFYGNDVHKIGELEIPHPHLHERNFVLKPLAELMKEFVHPVLKKSVKSLLEDSPDYNDVFLHTVKL